MTIQCTAALVHYAEQLHEPPRLDQFLTDGECREVAAYIDSLGPTPERANEFFTRRSALGDLQRNPSTGWNADDVREAHQAAKQHPAGNDLPDYAQQTSVVLRILVDYLKSSRLVRLWEVLTPDARMTLTPSSAGCPATRQTTRSSRPGGLSRMCGSWCEILETYDESRASCGMPCERKRW